jgi:hypothetical protein
MTELVAEFSSVEYMTDTKLSRLKRIPKATIDAVPNHHPFELKYHSLTKVPWETCAQVLDTVDQKTHLLRGWRKPG